MEEDQDYFLCDSCGNKEFMPVYSFSLRFHGVNFSDGLIYDELVCEEYQCTKCRKTFSKKNIENGMAELIRRRRPT
jgi:hypothetical protein